jgi:hypothetical protein
VDKCREAQEKTGKKDVGVVFEVDRYLCEGLTMGDEVSLWRGAPLATFIDYRPGSSALLMYAADELIAAIDNVARERAG